MMARSTLGVLSLLTSLATGCVVGVEDVGDDPGMEPSDEPTGDDSGSDSDVVYAPAGWSLTQNDVGLARHNKTCGSLPLYTGPMTPASGAVITDVRIEGTLTPIQQGVTLERVCVVGEIETGTVTIIDSEIVAPAPNGSTRIAYDGFAITMRNSYVHGHEIGLRFNGASSTQKVVIEDSIIEASRTPIRINYFKFGGTAVIRRNRITGADVTSAAILLQTTQPIANVTIERNLLSAPGALLMLSDPESLGITNVAAIDNRFVGTTNSVTNASWTTWRDNSVHLASNPDAKGSDIAAP